MTSHILTRHHQETHALFFSDQTLASHPSELGRWLLCLLPLLYVSLFHLFLLPRNLRININFTTKTCPSKTFVIAITIMGLVAAGVTGVWSCLNDLWTVKDWIFYAVILYFAAAATQLYTYDSSCTVLFAFLLVVVAAIQNQWFFFNLQSMPETDSHLTNVKHIVRNLIGFNQAILIIWAFQLLVQCLVYLLGFNQSKGGLSFWVGCLVTLIGILCWNLLVHKLYLDSIGFVVASIFFLIGVASSYLLSSLSSQNSSVKK